MKSYFGIATLLVIILGTELALADTKSESWADVNYVPCEGIGLSGSGRIAAHAVFAIAGGIAKVTQFSVVSDYQHPHSIAASVTYKSSNGENKKINLQKAWFSEIGPEGSRALYLPRNGNAEGPMAQTPFEMQVNSNLAIRLSTLFPVDGGNCTSNFTSTLKIP